MRTIELGSDMHCKIEVPHRLECDFRIGHRNSKIAAKTHQSLRAPIPHRLDSLDRGVALVAGRLDSEDAGQYTPNRIILNIRNSDLPISLHIRTPAHRNK